MAGVRRRGDHVLWRVNIPRHIAAEIEFALADPLRNKPTYGMRSQLVSQLLEKYLQDLKESADAHRPSSVPIPSGSASGASS